MRLPTKFLGVLQIFVKAHNSSKSSFEKWLSVVHSLCAADLLKEWYELCSFFFLFFYLTMKTRSSAWSLHKWHQNAKLKKNICIPGPWLLPISVVWFSLVRIFKKITQISSLFYFHYHTRAITFRGINCLFSRRFLKKKFCPYVWLVFKSGFYSRLGDNGAHMVHKWRISIFG